MSDDDDDLSFSLSHSLSLTRAQHQRESKSKSTATTLLLSLNPSFRSGSQIGAAPFVSGNRFSSFSPNASNSNPFRVVVAHVLVTPSAAAALHLGCFVTH
jgi:hypothetical protein